MVQIRMKRDYPAPQGTLRAGKVYPVPGELASHLVGTGTAEWATRQKETAQPKRSTEKRASRSRTGSKPAKKAAKKAVKKSKPRKKTARRRSKKD